MIFYSFGMFLERSPKSRRDDIPQRMGFNPTDEKITPSQKSRRDDIITSHIQTHGIFLPLPFLFSNESHSERSEESYSCKNTKRQFEMHPFKI